MVGIELMCVEVEFKGIGVPIGFHDKVRSFVCTSIGMCIHLCTWIGMCIHLCTWIGMYIYYCCQ